MRRRRTGGKEWEDGGVKEGMRRERMGEEARWECEGREKEEGV